jgi:hypothetical protein
VAPADHTWMAHAVAWHIGGMRRRLGIVKRTSWLMITTALIVSFALGSVVLVYLSTTRGGQPKVIVIACIIGVGVARWFRGDYRSR